MNIDDYIAGLKPGTKLAANAGTSDGVRKSWLKRRQEFIQALHEHVGGWAKEHGHSFGKVNDPVEGEHLTLSDKEGHSIIFKTLSPEQAERTLPDYRHEWPIPIGKNPKRRIYVTSVPEMRTLNDVRKYPSKLQSIMEQIKGAEYIHTD